MLERIKKLSFPCKRRKIMLNIFNLLENQIKITDNQDNSLKTKPLITLYNKNVRLGIVKAFLCRTIMLIFIPITIRPIN